MSISAIASDSTRRRTTAGGGSVAHVSEKSSAAEIPDILKPQQCLSAADLPANGASFDRQVALSLPLLSVLWFLRAKAREYLYWQVEWTTLNLLPWFVLSVCRRRVRPSFESHGFSSWFLCIACVAQVCGHAKKSRSPRAFRVRFVMWRRRILHGSIECDIGIT